MMSLFPGAPGTPPMQPVDVKNLYYQMMPGEWQRAFLNSGQVITDNNYTLLSFQRFMTLQEEQNQADVTRRRQQQQRVGRQHSGRQGRSPGRCIKVALITHINVLLFPLRAVVVAEIEVEDLKFIRPNHLISHRLWPNRTPKQNSSQQGTFCQ